MTNCEEMRLLLVTTLVVAFQQVTPTRDEWPGSSKQSFGFFPRFSVRRENGAPSSSVSSTEWLKSDRVTPTHPRSRRTLGVKKRVVHFLRDFGETNKMTIPGVYRRPEEPTGKKKTRQPTPDDKLKFVEVKKAIRRVDRKPFYKERFFKPGSKVEREHWRDGNMECAGRTGTLPVNGTHFKFISVFYCNDNGEVIVDLLGHVPEGPEWAWLMVNKNIINVRKERPTLVDLAGSDLEYGVGHRRYYVDVNRPRTPRRNLLWPFDGPELESHLVSWHAYPQAALIIWDPRYVNPLSIEIFMGGNLAKKSTIQVRTHEGYYPRQPRTINPLDFTFNKKASFRLVMPRRGERLRYHATEATTYTIVIKSKGANARWEYPLKHFAKKIPKNPNRPLPVHFKVRRTDFKMKYYDIEPKGFEELEADVQLRKTVRGNVFKRAVDERAEAKGALSDADFHGTYVQNQYNIMWLMKRERERMVIALRTWAWMLHCDSWFGNIVLSHTHFKLVGRAVCNRRENVEFVLRAMKNNGDNVFRLLKKGVLTVDTTLTSFSLGFEGRFDQHSNFLYAVELRTVDRDPKKTYRLLEHQQFNFTVSRHARPAKVVIEYTPRARRKLNVMVYMTGNVEAKSSVVLGVPNLVVYRNYKKYIHPVEYAWNLFHQIEVVYQGCMVTFLQRLLNGVLVIKAPDSKQQWEYKLRDVADDMRQSYKVNMVFTIQSHHFEEKTFEPFQRTFNRIKTVGEALRITKFHKDFHDRMRTRDPWDDGDGDVLVKDIETGKVKVNPDALERHGYSTGFVNRAFDQKTYEKDMQHRHGPVRQNGPNAM